MKVDMEMCGVICEEWVVMDVESKESVGGAFYVYS